jgi:hypothetical protein
MKKTKTQNKIYSRNVLRGLKINKNLYTKVQRRTHSGRFGTKYIVRTLTDWSPNYLQHLEFLSLTASVVSAEEISVLQGSKEFQKLYCVLRKAKWDILSHREFGR